MNIRGSYSKNSVACVFHSRCRRYVY